MLMRALAIATALLLTPAIASAQDAAGWERDVRLIERGVIQALDDEFMRSRKREKWDAYADQFRQGVERFEDVIDPVSYQIMLEIHRQLDYDFREIRREERWQDASFYIRNKFGLISFTLNATGR